MNTPRKRRIPDLWSARAWAIVKSKGNLEWNYYLGGFKIYKVKRYAQENASITGGRVIEIEIREVRN